MNAKSLEIIGFLMQLIVSSFNCKIVFSSFPPKILEQAGREYFINSKEHLTLPCRASGLPTPNYLWTRNGNVFNGSFSQVGGDLIIKKASEGFFQCVATNFLGSAFSDIAHVRISYQNKFKRTFRDKVVINATLGTYLILYCEIPYGIPKPQSYWVIRKVFSAQTIYESERITTDFEGNLYFARVELEDVIGGYQCVINNSVAKILTYGKEYVIRITENNSKNQVSSILLWKSPDHDVALQGHSKILKCIFSKNQYQMVSWTKLNSHLSKNVVNRGNELFFNNVTFSDQGIYRCAVNKQTWHDTYLNVEAIPSWTNPKKDMVDANILEGESISLTCRARGVPKPSITWYYNGIPVRDKFSISKDNDIYFTTIENATKTDSKVVQCNASNKHGYVFANAYINVLAEPPKALESQVQVIVTKGSNLTLNCPVIGWPEPFINWHSSGGIIVATNKSKYAIYHVSFDNQIICRGHNKYGEKEVTFFVKTKNKTKVKLTSINKYAYEGEELLLNCSIITDELHVLTKVVWLKNGIVLNSDFTKDTNSVEKRHLLSINPAQLSDGGLYTCNVSTSYDWNSDSKQIFIRGPPMPPVIVRVSNCSSTNAVLTWIDEAKHFDPVIEYLIFRNSSYDLSETYTTSVTSSKVLKAFFILNAWTNYSFHVRSRNIFGLSSPSSTSSQSCSTPSRKPGINPTDVCGENRSPNLLVITWKAVQPRYHFGEQFHYILKVKNLSHPHKEYIILKFNWSTTEAVIKDAGIYLPYKVWIHSANVHGLTDFNKNEVKLIYSGQHVPHVAPTNLRILDLTLHSAEFVWERVDELKFNGFLQGYQLNIWRTDDEIIHKTNVTTNVWFPCLRYVEHKLLRYNFSKEIKVRYHKLMPGITYRAGVAAMNAAGYVGHLSNLVKFQTKDGKPDKVENIKILEIASNHVTISWDLPRVTNGHLLGFDIECSLDDELNSSRKTILHSNESFYKLCDLIENTTYSILIYALTSAGRSEGNMIAVTTLSNATLSIPIITVTTANQNRVNISWSYENSAIVNKGCYYYLEYKKENNIRYSQSMPVSDNSWITLTDLPHGSYEIRIMVTSLKNVVRSKSNILKLHEESFVNEATTVAFSILGVIFVVATLLKVLLKNCRTKVYVVNHANEGLRENSENFQSLAYDSSISLKSDKSLNDYQDPDIEIFGEDGSYNGIY